MNIESLKDTLQALMQKLECNICTYQKVGNCHLLSFKDINGNGLNIDLSDTGVHVGELFIPTEFRRKGYGGEIVKIICDWMRANKIEKKMSLYDASPYVRKGVTFWDKLFENIPDIYLNKSGTL